MLNVYRGIIINHQGQLSLPSFPGMQIENWAIWAGWLYS